MNVLRCIHENSILVFLHFFCGPIAPPREKMRQGLLPSLSSLLFAHPCFLSLYPSSPHLSWEWRLGADIGVVKPNGFLSEGETHVACVYTHLILYMWYPPVAGPECHDSITSIFGQKNKNFPDWLYHLQLYFTNIILVDISCENGQNSIVLHWNLWQTHQ